MPHPTGGYKNAAGEKVPSVTTILGRYKESGGLLFWAFEQGKAAQRGEIEKLYDKRDEAAEAGTLAHSLVEAHIRGLPLPDLSPYPANIVIQANQGYQNYIHWQEDNRIEIIHQEVGMVSEQYQYAGCLDAIGRNSRGELCLLDWKTSDTGPYVDYLLQLAGYMTLWTETHHDEPLTGGYHLCKFSKHGADFAHFYWSDLTEAEEYFLLLVRAYQLDKILKKRL